ncbi:hypothetical protein D3C78_1859660 [compost metagenome]
MAASTSLALTISVSRSTSIITGVAPSNSIMLRVETQVWDGVITSSPGPMFNAIRVICIPAVAEQTAIACLQPKVAQNSLSNC